MLRRRCEQSPVSPTERAARKRAAATAVAGEGVTQTGAEAPPPEHLVGRRPHLLTRSCTYTTHALTQGTQHAYRTTTDITSQHYEAYASKRRRYADFQQDRRRQYCAANDVRRVSAATKRVKAICIPRTHARCTHASVLRIPPNGKQRCGGARSTCSGGQWDREVPPSRVSIRAFITNLVPQRE